MFVRRSVPPRGLSFWGSVRTDGLEVGAQRAPRLLVIDKTTKYLDIHMKKCFGVPSHGQIVYKWIVVDHLDQRVGQ